LPLAILRRVLRAGQIGGGAVGELDLDLEGDLGVDAGRQPRRGDAGRVGHLIGCPTRRRRPRGSRGRRIARDVARGDEQREPQLGRAVLEERQALGGDEADRDLLARRQVADLDGEDVVAVLLESAARLPLLDGLGVGAARFAALLDDALDDAGADLELEGADGRAAGEREDVDGLEGLRERVAELLLHRDLGHAVGDRARRCGRRPAAAGRGGPRG
jgi:hypothetical protein